MWYCSPESSALAAAVGESWKAEISSISWVPLIVPPARAIENGGLDANVVPAPLAGGVNFETVKPPVDLTSMSKPERPRLSLLLSSRTETVQTLPEVVIDNVAVVAWHTLGPTKSVNNPRQISAIGFNMVPPIIREVATESVINLVICSTVVDSIFISLTRRAGVRGRGKFGSRKWCGSKQMDRS